MNEIITLSLDLWLYDKDIMCAELLILVMEKKALIL